MQIKSDTKEVEVINIPYGYGKKIAKKLNISDTYLSTICKSGAGGIVLRTKLKRELEKLNAKIKREANR